jgi:hypothetical protein
MTATSLNCKIVEAYKGYSIQPDFRNPYNRNPEYMFYLTSQGIDHDYDMDSDGYRYCGNCKWADSIEECKLLIDEIVPFLVETHGPIPLGGHAQLHVTKFNWLSDAVRFASKFNGSLNVNFNAM